MFANVLGQLAQNASTTIEALGSIADSIANVTDRVTGAVPGLQNALSNFAQFGPVLGTAKTALDNFNLGGQGSEVDTSQFVPQQDELDKSVRFSRAATERIAADSERAAKRAASERAKADKEAAEAFEQANKEAISNIEIAQQNRIAAVRQNQSAGLITEDEADTQISTIEQDAIRDRIALREEEITRIEEFASRQTISEKDAADQIRGIREEIADLTLEGIEKEIAAQEAAADAAKDKAEEAKKAALEQLDAQQRLNDLQAEQVNIQSSIASTALQDQTNLISAQVDLEQSRLSLSRQNLEGKLAEAEAVDDVAGIEAIRDRLLLNQRQSIQANFSAQREQLRIQQQLAQLDADRQLQLGQIAAAESRIAVERARAEGASSEEINALQEITQLREQETEALESQADSKRDILSLQLDQLNAQEELAEQTALQERREQAIQSFKEQQKDLADEQLRTEKDLGQCHRTESKSC